MKRKNRSRREFLKQLALAGAGTVVAPVFLRAQKEQGFEAGIFSGKSNTPFFSRPRPSGAKSVAALRTKPLETVRIGFIGLGRRGFGVDSRRTNSSGNRGLLGEILNIPFSRVVAVSDSDAVRANAAAAFCLSLRADVPAPRVYAGTENAWEKLCERSDIDVVCIATPWHLHAPMAIAAMNAGKHVFVEVPAVLSLDECWALVDASERTQRHCIMLENCCFGDEELFVLNMVYHGVFGKLVHAECAYIHDLRALLFRAGTEGEWRREYHRVFDGNLYPTHGLGPVCRYFGINREDALDFLVSVSSSEAGLSEFRQHSVIPGDRFAGEKYVCGDMNTTLIKTALGRTILLQHNVVSPRPYSRINLLAGTRATFSGYPPRLALDVPEKYDLQNTGAGTWLGERDFSKMLNTFRNPFWREYGDYLRNRVRGGMDYAMCYRLLDCIRKGNTPEITVYDSATWSCIVELSARSVSGGSVPVRIPDFTRGEWRA